MGRFRRDRTALVFLALVILGALLLGGVLLAVFLPGGKHRAAPGTTTTQPSTQPPATSAPPPTTTVAPPTTSVAPPTTTVAPPPATTAPPPPPPPLQAVSVGPFSAVVEWTKADPPARVAYGLPDLGPTMWAPVTGKRATLSGLRFSTAYRVWAGDATLDLTTAPPPGSPAAAIGGGVILLDGQPFFPLIVLAQCPTDYGSSLAAGITLYAENPCGGISAQTEGLAGRALSLTSAAEVGTGGPGVIGWYYPDEADLKGMTGATLPQFPTLAATGRLRVLTLTNHFYSATAPLGAGRGVYPGLISKSDVVGFDLYPLQEFCNNAWLPAVAYAQRELVRLAGERPTFQWIETRTWKCHRRSLQVTAATVRAESWLSIVGGARGVGFFPAGWDPIVTPAITALSREIGALGAPLAAPDTAVTATVPIIAIARSVNGALYVFAVNPTRTARRATIQASGLAGRSLSVLGEARNVGASGDRFEDAFAPLAVHLYVAAPA